MIVGSLVLLLGGFVTLTLSEWGNPATLKPLSVPAKILGGIGLSVFPRTGGFNSLNIGELRDESWFITDVLMFIGAGPAGTSGGLKISTVAVIGAIAITEIRGNRVTHIYDRAIPAASQRAAVAVAAAFTAITLVSIAVMMAITPFEESAVVTEVVSALGTVGLTTGITPELSAPAQLLEMLLMFIGRLGPVTFAAALALNSRTTLYTLPEERPFIG
jgi:Trk-type K+ transport system membrane component